LKAYPSISRRDGRSGCLCLAAVVVQLVACGNVADSAEPTTGGAAGVGGMPMLDGGMPSTGTDAGGPRSFPCNDSVPLAGAGSFTGYYECSGFQGFMHRTEQVACVVTAPRTQIQECTNAMDQCRSDADCADVGAIPYCDLSGFMTIMCFCNQGGCRTDADCGPGFICVCDDPVGQCFEASCVTDADCPSGMLCASYLTCPGTGAFQAFACQSPSDACGGTVDCPRGTYCTIENGARVCAPPTCYI
jgi:hypothetical protein